jgi:hypothetical protein
MIYIYILIPEVAGGYTKGMIFTWDGDFPLPDAQLYPTEEL